MPQLWRIVVALAVLAACSQAPPPIVGVWDRGQSLYAAFLPSGEIYDCGPRATVGTWRAVGANSYQLVVTDRGRTETALATMRGVNLHIEVTGGNGGDEQADWTRARELGVCS
ncbi:MAG: hypothetical protein ABL883_10680 [Terricaulis sp.]